MSKIVYDPNFDPNSKLGTTNLAAYNGLIKNAPFEPTFTIDPSTGQLTSAATISTYNKISIGGYVFPGSNTVSINREKKIKKERPMVAVGNQVLDTGINLAKVNIDTHLFNDTDISDFQKILDFFEQRQGKAPEDGFTVINPSCTSRGVKNVYLEGIEGPIYEGGKTIFKSRWTEVVKVKTTATRKIKPAKQNNNGPIASDEKSSDEKYGDNNAVPPSQDPKNTKPRTQPQPKRTPS